MTEERTNTSPTKPDRLAVTIGGRRIGKTLAMQKAIRDFALKNPGATIIGWKETPTRKQR